MTGNEDQMDHHEHGAGAGHGAGQGTGHGTEHGDAQSIWEGRYRESAQIWSGRANATLVDVVGSLKPGRALDLGCGEGGDSVWLAESGWRVTGMDISPTALERAAALAASRGVPAASITWVQQDLAAWQPGPDDAYDLVSACFLHSPVDGFPREEVLRRAADAVAPGGALLVVGHAGPPPWMDPSAACDHRFLSPEEELDGLGLPREGWQVLIGELRTREATGPDGRHGELTDTVVLARREG
ncbi:class I SAM-dependent methyltransferase [Microbacterium sp. STN6]|uniref:class I SAM-dependent methyltransferase n=1 Tax=Microbacterium sp. STN6 TaxID=2995588 RepID=UPI002260FBE9|nr:class I SAM-dependent methyltransferase [Microbacterium sp. STN6]MCX7522573.1 class I SAM-dependent methyltransferase [Microbacterium sp. STN6]